MVIVRPTVRREPIYSPRRWICIARRLFNSNNLFSSAALAEVCALLSVILVYSVVLCLPFPVWFAYINYSLQCCCSFPIFYTVMPFVSWCQSNKHGLNSAGSCRIPDPEPPSWNPANLFGDPARKLGDPLEFCSAMSLLVITHHDSYKYAFKTIPLQHVAVVVFLVNRKTRRCSQTRCRSSLYLPTIVISFLDSSFFLV